MAHSNECMIWETQPAGDDGWHNCTCVVFNSQSDHDPLAADTIKNHKVQHGRCLCLAYVESEEQHRDDIIRRYVASALTRDGQEMGLIP